MLTVAHCDPAGAHDPYEGALVCQWRFGPPVEDVAAWHPVPVVVATPALYGSRR
jgi:hypothetical protein